MKKPIDIGMVLEAAESDWRGGHIDLNNIAHTVKAVRNLVHSMLRQMTPEQLLAIYQDVGGEITYSSNDPDYDYEYVEYEVVARLPDESE